MKMVSETILRIILTSGSGNHFDHFDGRMIENVLAGHFENHSHFVLPGHFGYFRCIGEMSQRSFATAILPSEQYLSYRELILCFTLHNIALTAIY